MVALFQYPKTKHTRKLLPRRQFKRYQTYKVFLQAEFERVCVYCRQPDSSAPNLNFGVDHYRPKGDPRFANLVCAYNNLFYCCGSCNSRKTNYWPIDERAGPYIVNPCDHEMATHLRFDKNTGRIEPKDDTHGKYTEELLQLNDSETVQYRLGVLTIVRLLSREIDNLQAELKTVDQEFRAGHISQAKRDQVVQLINIDLAEVRKTVSAQTGELPLPRLRGTLLVTTE